MNRLFGAKKKEEPKPEPVKGPGLEETSAKVSILYYIFKIYSSY